MLAGNAAGEGTAHQLAAGFIDTYQTADAIITHDGAGGDAVQDPPGVAAGQQAQIILMPVGVDGARHRQILNGGAVLNVAEQAPEQFASAEKTTTEANQLKGQYEDALKSAKEESFSIVEQAKDEAKVQADSIVKRANDQAGQILEKARRDISTEQEAAMKAMEGKVAELAMDAASRIMGKKNDEAQDMSLYDQFLEGAGDPHDRDVH